MEHAIEIKRKIIEYSKAIGIDQIGFTTAEPFDEHKAIVAQYRESGFSSGFEEQDIEKRLNPQIILPGAKTIISIALAYPNHWESSKKKNSGLFCRASWGVDYHVVLEEKLEKLSRYIHSLVEELEIECRYYVDTGPLSDRSIAQRAGIGWIGRNSNLITKQYGSFVYLGEIITTLDLPADLPAEGNCDGCQRCVQACPLGAIDGENRMVNCQKCLAYLTLDKQYPSHHVAKEIGRRGHIYGCDICQLVCPYNHEKENQWPEDFQQYKELVEVELLPLLTISNKQFKEQYGSLAGSWRGKKVLQRNAIFILGYRKLEEALPLLQQISRTDERWDIRQAALWAINCYEFEGKKTFLHERLEQETDDRVREYIQELTLIAGSKRHSE